MEGFFSTSAQLLLGYFGKQGIAGNLIPVSIDFII
jgi:hypothetical protein